MPAKSSCASNGNRSRKSSAPIKLLERSLVEHPIRAELPADLPLLEFDSVLIERVLCNLLENAAKYSPSGSSIEISAKETDASVEVAVRDHGPGLATIGRADIFAMFVRGAKESSKPGVGLGLAICRAIVEAHEGTIAATSHASGGACFTFTLPKRTPPTIDVEEPTEAFADG